MNWRARFITDYLWRKIPKKLRKELLKTLRKDMIVHRYAYQVANYLVSEGETKCANKFMDFLENM